MLAVIISNHTLELILVLTCYHALVSSCLNISISSSQLFFKNNKDTFGNNHVLHFYLQSNEDHKPEAYRFIHVIVLFTDSLSLQSIISIHT